MLLTLSLYCSERTEHSLLSTVVAVTMLLAVTEIAVATAAAAPAADAITTRCH
jgi:hypothetical protein